MFVFNEHKKILPFIIILSLSIFFVPEEFLEPLNTANMRAYWSALNLFWMKVNPYDGTILSSFVLQKLNIEQSVEKIWHLPAVFIFPLYFSKGNFLHFIKMQFLVSMIFYVIASALLFKNYYSNLKIESRKSELFLLLILCFLFSPLVQALALSPVSTMYLFGFSTFLYFEKDAKKSSLFLSGFFLSLTALKPTLLLFVYTDLLLRSFLKKDGVQISGFLFGIAVLIALPAIFNSNIYTYYFEILQNKPLDWLNPNLATWIQILFGIHDYNIKYFIPFLGSLPFILLQIRKYRRERDFYSHEILVLVSLLFCPYLWGYDFILLLPLAFSLVRKSLLAGFVIASVNILALLVPSSIYSHYFIWYPITFSLILLLGNSLKNNLRLID